MNSRVHRKQFVFSPRYSQYIVLLMPLAETIKELVSFILEGVDLLDHTSIFLLRTINHRVIPIIRILS